MESARRTGRIWGDEYVDPEIAAPRLQLAFDWAAMMAAIAVIPISITLTETGDSWGTAAFSINILVWLVFLTEFLVLGWISKSYKRWMIEHKLEMVILIATVPLLPEQMGILRLLRLLALGRLFKVRRMSQWLFSADGIKGTTIVFVTSIVVAGVLFGVSDDPGAFDAWQGLYWAAVTASTVGYGDVVPTTPLARTIAVVLMGVAFIFMAIITGAIADKFVNNDPETHRRETARHDELLEALAASLRETRALNERLEKLEQGLGKMRERLHTKLDEHEE